MSSLDSRRVPPLVELVLTYEAAHHPPVDDEQQQVADVTAHATTPWTKDTRRFGSRPDEEPFGPAGAGEAGAASARLVALFGADASYYSSRGPEGRRLTTSQSYRESASGLGKCGADTRHVSIGLLSRASPGTLAHPGTITDFGSDNHQLYDANFFPGLSYKLRVQALNTKNDRLSATAAATAAVVDIPDPLLSHGHVPWRACALLQPSSGAAAAILAPVAAPTPGSLADSRGNTDRFTHFRSIATFFTGDPSGTLIDAALVLDRTKMANASAGIAFQPIEDVLLNEAGGRHAAQEGAGFDAEGTGHHFCARVERSVDGGSSYAAFPAGYAGVRAGRSAVAGLGTFGRYAMSADDDQEASVVAEDDVHAGLRLELDGQCDVCDGTSTTAELSALLQVVPQKGVTKSLGRDIYNTHFYAKVNVRGLSAFKPAEGASPPPRKLAGKHPYRVALEKRYGGALVAVTGAATAAPSTSEVGYLNERQYAGGYDTPGSSTGIVQRRYSDLFYFEKGVSSSYAPVVDRVKINITSNNVTTAYNAYNSTGDRAFVSGVPTLGDFTATAEVDVRRLGQFWLPSGAPDGGGGNNAVVTVEVGFGSSYSANKVAVHTDKYHSGQPLQIRRAGDPPPAPVALGADGDGYQPDELDDAEATNHGIHDDDTLLFVSAHDSQLPETNRSLGIGDIDVYTDGASTQRVAFRTTARNRETDTATVRHLLDTNGELTDGGLAAFCDLTSLRYLVGTSVDGVTPRYIAELLVGSTSPTMVFGTGKAIPPTRCVLDTSSFSGYDDDDPDTIFNVALTGADYGTSIAYYDAGRFENVTALSFVGTDAKITVYDHKQALGVASDPYERELIFANGRLRSTAATSTYYKSYSGFQRLPHRAADAMPDYDDALDDPAEWRYATFRYDLSRQASVTESSRLDILLLDTNFTTDDYTSAPGSFGNRTLKRDYFRLYGKFVDPSEAQTPLYAPPNDQESSGNRNTNWFDCNAKRDGYHPQVDYHHYSDMLAVVDMNSYDGNGTDIAGNHVRLRTYTPLAYPVKGKILLLRLGLKPRSGASVPSHLIGTEVSVGTIMVQPLTNSADAGVSL